MSFLSKIFVAASIAMLSFASPSSAQSFSIYAGTGNVLPAYFEANGALHRGIAPSQNTLAEAGSSLAPSAPVTNSYICTLAARLRLWITALIA